MDINMTNEKKRALGRGLETLLPRSRSQESGDRSQEGSSQPSAISHQEKQQHSSQEPGDRSQENSHPPSAFSQQEGSRQAPAFSHRQNLQSGATIAGAGASTKTEEGELREIAL